MLLSQKIERLMMKHDDSRRVVGSYLLREGTSIEGRSMQRIAEDTYTSKSTLVRIAKQLGFAGWNPFIRSYLDELKYQASHFDTNTDHNIPFTETSSPKNIADALCQVHMESAWQSNQNLDMDELLRAADTLRRAERVALFGISVNELLLKLLQRKLLTIGVQALMVPQAEHKLLAHSLTDRDCAVMVSYSGSGELRTPMNLIPILENHGTPIIALTSEGDNYLRQHAQSVLTIYSQERLYSKISTFSTEESILYLLDCLFALYFASDYQSNLAKKISTEKSIEINRQTSRNLLDNLD